MKKQWIVGSLVLALCAVFPAAQAGDDGAFQIRLGGFFPEGDSNFWRDNEETFTLETGDFDDFEVGASFINSMGNHFEVGFNVDYYAGETLSAYRGFVDSAGFPIFHDARLKTIPLSVDFRVLPAGRYAQRGHGGRHHVKRPAVYLGAGVGTTYWEYEEVGDFLDFGFDPPEIFFDRFTEDGFAFSTHALAGVELPVGDAMGLTFEGRYRWADDKLEGDFAGLGDLDLGGFSVSVGAAFRF